MEEWRPVASSYDPNLCANLEVSSFGSIRTRNTQRHYCGYQATYGYPYINVNKKKLYAHILIAETFLGPLPKGMGISHKDGNKMNNRLSNLHYEPFNEKESALYEAISMLHNDKRRELLLRFLQCP